MTTPPDGDMNPEMLKPMTAEECRQKFRDMLNSQMNKPHPAAIRDNMKTNKFTVVGISRSELLKTVNVVASNEKEAIKRAKKKFIGGLRDCRVTEIV